MIDREKIQHQLKLPFLSIEDGQLVLDLRRRVTVEGARRKYLKAPARKQDAIELGRRMRKCNIIDWMLSSSINHPTEYGARRNHDFGLLVRQGWCEIESERLNKLRKKAIERIAERHDLPVATVEEVIFEYEEEDFSVAGDS